MGLTRADFYNLDNWLWWPLYMFKTVLKKLWLRVQESVPLNIFLKVARTNCLGTTWPTEDLGIDSILSLRYT